MLCCFAVLTRNFSRPSQRLTIGCLLLMYKSECVWMILLEGVLMLEGAAYFRWVTLSICHVHQHFYFVINFKKLKNKNVRPSCLYYEWKELDIEFWYFNSCTSSYSEAINHIHQYLYSSFFSGFVKAVICLRIANMTELMSQCLDFSTSSRYAALSIQTSFYFGHHLIHRCSYSS